jgi:putative ABC transport system ATP-binding protein
VIAVAGLEKTFDQPGGDRVRALCGIDLDLSGGQFLTVIGSNGSGKSTILNAIAGTFLPDAGTITIGGREVTRLPEHRRAELIGRVFQDPFKGTCPSMTVAENLRLAEQRGERRRLRIGLDRRCLERYRELLASLGMRLEGRLQAMMGTLSGGQRQAVTLLMATIRRPALLLLDEHTAALDPRAAEQIMAVTDQVVRTHALTTLMVTHSMEHAVQFGDRTVMMHRGSIIADLQGEERKGVTEADLLVRFAELRHTAEMRFTQELAAAPAGTGARPSQSRLQGTAAGSRPAGASS